MQREKQEVERQKRESVTGRGFPFLSRVFVYTAKERKI